MAVSFLFLRDRRLLISWSDGHDDLAILIRFVYHNNIYSKDFASHFENGGMPRHVDLPRLRAGKVGGTFWSAFTLCPANGTDFSDANYAECMCFPFVRFIVFYIVTRPLRLAVQSVKH